MFVETLIFLYIFAGKVVEHQLTTDFLNSNNFFGDITVGLSKT